MATDGKKRKVEGPSPSRDYNDRDSGLTLMTTIEHIDIHWFLVLSTTSQLNFSAPSLKSSTLVAILIAQLTCSALDAMSPRLGGGLSSAFPKAFTNGFNEYVSAVRTDIACQ